MKKFFIHSLFIFITMQTAHAGICRSALIGFYENLIQKLPRDTLQDLLKSGKTNPKNFFLPLEKGGVEFGQIKEALELLQLTFFENFEPHFIGPEIAKVLEDQILINEQNKSELQLQKAAKDWEKRAELGLPIKEIIVRNRPNQALSKDGLTKAEVKYFNSEVHVSTKKTYPQTYPMSTRWEILRRLIGGQIIKSALSPDGTMTAIIQYRGMGNRIVVWPNISGEKPVRIIYAGENDSFQALAFSPNGEEIFAGTKKGNLIKFNAYSIGVHY